MDTELTQQTTLIPPTEPTEGPVLQPAEQPVEPRQEEPSSPPVNMPEPPVTPFFQKKSIIISVILLALLLGGILAGKMLIKEEKPVLPTPTPTATLTPTPIRKLSDVATQSAFLTLEASVASLSSYLNGIQIIDSTLTPPSVELPLGFQN